MYNLSYRVQCTHEPFSSRVKPFFDKNFHHPLTFLFRFSFFYKNIKIYESLPKFLTPKCPFNLFLMSFVISIRPAVNVVLLKNWIALCMDLTSCSYMVYSYKKGRVTHETSLLPYMFLFFLVRT